VAQRRGQHTSNSRAALIQLGDSLIIKHFRGATGDDAGAQASVGRGKLALVPNESASPPLLRLACRDVYERAGGEQEMLAQLVEAVAGDHSSRALVVTYYVSLKTNPFVVLTGAVGRGKTEFVQRFADALIGRAGSQYALIAGADSWPSNSGQNSYYRTLQGVSRFIGHVVQVCG